MDTLEMDILYILFMTAIGIKTLQSIRYIVVSDSQTQFRLKDIFNSHSLMPVSLVPGYVKSIS